MAARTRVDLIFHDTHYPNHHEPSIEAVCAIADAIRPTRIVCLGDGLDCGVFSSHPRGGLEDVASSYLADEVAPFNRLLDRLCRGGRVPLVYVAGNHEHRVERLLVKTAGPAAADLSALASPERLIRFRVGADGKPRGERKGLVWVPYPPQGDVTSHFALAPNLIGIHGWSHAARAAQVHLDRARNVSVVFGHTHRAESATGRIPLTGETLVAWSAGCLCLYEPVWRVGSAPSTWTRGISLVYHGRHNPRNWTQYAVPIQDRGVAVLPDGREIRAA